MAEGGKERERDRRLLKVSGGPSRLLPRLVKAIGVAPLSFQLKQGHRPLFFFFFFFLPTSLILLFF